MRTSTVFRLAAVGFVSMVIGYTALDLTMTPRQPAASASVAPTEQQSDPLRSELLRCQSIGTAAANDGACLRAWAENRRRFLAPGARPQAAIAATPLLNAEAAIANGSALAGESH